MKEEHNVHCRHGFAHLRRSRLWNAISMAYQIWMLVMPQLPSRMFFKNWTACTELFRAAFSTRFPTESYPCVYSFVIPPILIIHSRNMWHTSSPFSLFKKLQHCKSLFAQKKRKDAGFTSRFILLRRMAAASVWLDARHIFCAIKMSSKGWLDRDFDEFCCDIHRTNNKQLIRLFRLNTRLGVDASLDDYNLLLRVCGLRMLLKPHIHDTIQILPLQCSIRHLCLRHMNKQLSVVEGGRNKLISVSSTKQVLCQWPQDTLFLSLPFVASHDPR